MEFSPTPVLQDVQTVPLNLSGTPILNLEKTKSIHLTMNKRSISKKSSLESRSEDFVSFLKDNKIKMLPENVMEAFERGENIGYYLSKESAICPFIYNGEIKFGETPLGKGKYGAAYDVLINLKTNKKYVVKDSILSKIPGPCEQIEKYKLNNKGGSIFRAPKGSLFCKEAISEFYISLLISQFVQKNISVNFFETYFFAMCREDKSFHQFTFMDKIIGDTLYKNRAMLSIQDIDSIYVQVLHAIGLYQKYYDIVHGDLHYNNVFLEKSTSEYDIYEYKIGKSKIYTSAKYTAKIGDWGMAVKYKDKMIGNINIIANRLNTPNFYNKVYDLLFFTLCVDHMIKQNSKFISNILKWIFNGLNPEDFYKKDNLRPYIDQLDQLYYVNPISILTNPNLMQHYSFEPSSNTRVFAAGII